MITDPSLPGVGPSLDGQRVGGGSVAVAGRGGPGRSVGRHGDAEPAMGLGAVVVAAPSSEVSGGGESFGPRHGMIQVAPLRRDLADRVGTDAIAKSERRGELAGRESTHL